MTDDKEVQGWCGRRPDGRLVISTCGGDLWQAWGLIEDQTVTKRSVLQKAGWTVVCVTVTEKPND